MLSEYFYNFFNPAHIQKQDFNVAQNGTLRMSEVKSS